MLWPILFWAAAGLLLLALAAVVFLAVKVRRQKEEWDPQGREMYISYPEPDYTNAAGFRIERFPQTEILIPQSYWLINDRIAEVEYNVVPSERVWLRLAESGCLECPAGCGEALYQSTATYLVDGVPVQQRQTAGGWTLLRWSRSGFDFALYAPSPQMNLLGGVIQTFVSEMEILQSA